MNFVLSCPKCQKNTELLINNCVPIKGPSNKLYFEAFWFGCKNKCSCCYFYFNSKFECFHYGILLKSNSKNQIYEMYSMNIDDNPVSELHYGNDLRSELSIRLKKFIPFDFSLSFSDAILNFEKKIKIFKNFK